MSGKLRYRVAQGLTVLGVILSTAVLSACGHQPQPSVTSTAVPGLGTLTVAKFAPTPAGSAAQTLCEQWSGLRGQYVAALDGQTPRELGVWFSGPVWSIAYAASRDIATDTSYGNIYTAYAVATIGSSASVGNARLLDQACAAGD